MVAGVLEQALGWEFDRSSRSGTSARFLQNRPVSELHNLGRGWVGFDYEAAFALPVKMINDAAMQALGSYEGGKMLFLGLGTGIGNEALPSRTAFCATDGTRPSAVQRRRV